MTRDITPDLTTIKLYLTEPHPCSYLADEEATTAFVDPSFAIDAQLYSRLSELGFRRSGRYLYEPRCKHCSACIPVRIPVDKFAANRSQQKCWNRNHDLSLDLTRQPDHEEHYQLYSQYISGRHNDGDMYPPSVQQYEDFIANLWTNSQVMEFRRDHELMAAAVIDWVDSGISAIYTYFSPQQTRRGLGTFAILSQIALAKAKGRPYVYLGYWIKDCRKMAYKKSFKPIEMHINDRWITLK